MARGKQFTDEEKRQIVWARMKGVPYEAIADRFERSAQTIMNLVNRMKKEYEYDEIEYELRQGDLEKAKKERTELAAKEAVISDERRKQSVFKDFKLEFQLALIKAVAKAAIAEVEKFEHNI